MNRHKDWTIYTPRSDLELETGEKQDRCAHNQNRWWGQKKQSEKLKEDK